MRIRDLAYRFLTIQPEQPDGVEKRFKSPSAWPE